LDCLVGETAAEVASADQDLHTGVSTPKVGVYAIYRSPDEWRRLWRRIGIWGARVLCQDNVEPLTRQMVQTRAERAARRAGLAQDVHILRHTFCSRLANARGAGARDSGARRHQDLSMTQRYMHLSPTALDAAIRLLEQPAGPAKSGRDVAEATDGPKDFGNMVETGRRQ
jgi:integrase